jgi:hypothetical protein
LFPWKKKSRSRSISEQSRWSFVFFSLSKLTEEIHTFTLSFIISIAFK